MQNVTQLLVDQEDQVTHSQRCRQKSLLPAAKFHPFFSLFGATCHLSVPFRARWASGMRQKVSRECGLVSESALGLGATLDARIRKGVERDSLTSFPILSGLLRRT